MINLIRRFFRQIIHSKPKRETTLKYSPTENSPFAKGAPKAEYRGVDSFGESQDLDPEQRHPDPH